MTLDREIGAVDDERLRESLALGRLAYGDTEVSHEAHMRWKHLQGPAGGSHAVLLRSNHEVVGRVLLQARWLRRGNRRWRAAFLSDLVLHPDHRGMENFLALVRDVRSTNDFDLIYVTPSTTSLLLFERALDFAPPRLVSVWAAPLRCGALLRRLVAGPFGASAARLLERPIDALLSLGTRSAARLVGAGSLEIQSGWPSDDEVRALDRKLEAAPFVAAPRDPNFLRWRFAPPERDGHRFWTVRDEGRLIGWCATRTCEAEGFRTAFLIDLLFSPDVDSRKLAAARLMLLECAASTGADIALGFFAEENPWLRRFCRFPLLRVPERWLPQPVKLFAEAARPVTRPTREERREGNPELPRLSDAYWTLADLDVY